MIYTNKKKLALAIWVSRPTLNKMLNKWEAKAIYDDNWKRVGYIELINFIKYLVNL